MTETESRDHQHREKGLLVECLASCNPRKRKSSDFHIGVIICNYISHACNGSLTVVNPKGRENSVTHPDHDYTVTSN